MVATLDGSRLGVAVGVAVGEVLGWLVGGMGAAVGVPVGGKGLKGGAEQRAMTEIRGGGQIPS